MPGRDVEAVTTGRPDLVELLTATSRRVERAVSAALAEDGGTLEGYRVLRALAAAPGVTMGQLVARLQLPGPTATRVVDGLVDATLAHRLPDPEDRRRVVVHLSAAGRTRLARWESLVEAREAALARSLGQDRVDALAQALTELVEEPGAADR
ncbi:MarR family transcriptional regulator [Modestobacter sp. L9-4]|uniref:MarR family winged helix-turn-helix transcriptional regulator n=1 Tax=Modestobacter sp. L9-4 TaxID=2851567 RepID=UPI001C76EF9A|nr:MarR family transcriptional regulator [Modestobacter sp. L9-4]QXG75595.1 MarR family transcriptional regulator [Modestobacter sp. L9-4]